VYILIGILVGYFLFKYSKNSNEVLLQQKIETLTSQISEQKQAFINEKQSLLKEKEDMLRAKDEDIKIREKEIREDAIKRSKSVMLGKMWEQIVPHYRPTDFTFIPSDARFLGSPIDFVIFKGASEGEIEEVVFLEIKTAKSRMNSQQVKLKKVIDSLGKDSKVKWVTINIPIELDKSDES
jgi:predicted Holliday junction resolvase-like endonuclease